MKTPDEDARHGRWIGAASGRRQNMAIVTVALVLCLVAGLHLALWGLAEPRTTAAPVEGKLPSLSYNRFTRPSSGNLTVSEAQVRADLTAIAKLAKAIRTYASTQGLERVPEIAAELGLSVTLGIWIGKDEARNEREIETALDLARRNPNVTRLVVGNETVFRRDRTAAEIAEIVRRVKRDSPLPVATADHWKTFLDSPELVDAVDQVFAHIIPYWEGYSRKSAVEGSLALYDRLRAAYPGKKIVIGEYGWHKLAGAHNSGADAPFRARWIFQPGGFRFAIRDFVSGYRPDAAWHRLQYC